MQRFKSKSLINSNKYRHENETKRKTEEKSFSNFNFHQFLLPRAIIYLSSAESSGIAHRGETGRMSYKEHHNQVLIDECSNRITKAFTISSPDSSFIGFLAPCGSTNYCSTFQLLGMLNLCRNFRK